MEVNVDAAGRWACTPVDTGVVHVSPIGDVVEHDLTAECWCIPAAELVPNPNGPDGWLYSHSSMDGREAHE